MKDTWIIQIEQLEEWKELLSKGDSQSVIEQIDDIVDQAKDN